MGAKLQEIFSLLMLILCLSACASRLSSREAMDRVNDSSSAKAGAFIGDVFYLDLHSPADREVQKWEFYYKQCELVSRKRFPKKTEHECGEPF
jgi:hypothetical protein